MRKFIHQESVRRWSLRKVSTGVASVVVASGFFFIAPGQETVHADTPSQTFVSTEQDARVEEASSTDSGGVVTPVSAESEVKTEETAPTTMVESPKEVIPTSEVVVGNSVESNVSNRQVSLESATNEDVSSEVLANAQNAVEESSKEVTPVEKVQESVQANVKESTDVPVSYLTNAQSPGPFTAGVNQVIPYEFFGGDGMLTRLLLKSSDTAPWSDNGKDKNATLLPVEKLGNGQYFYQVALDGNAAGKQDKALLDQLQANGTQDYTATVFVYGAKDGKADLDNVVATRMVKVHFVKEMKSSDMKHMKDGMKQGHGNTMMSTPGMKDGMKQGHGNTMMSTPDMSDGMKQEHGNTMMSSSDMKDSMKQEMDSHKMSPKMTNSAKSMSLPSTGEKGGSLLSLVGAAILSVLGVFGLYLKKEKN